MQPESVRHFREWFTTLNPRFIAMGIGLAIGVIGGLVGLSLALIGPVLTIPIIIGILAALYVLTDVTIALYAMIATMIMLPFGTFPVKIGITPTLLDLALGAFVVVYLLQWMMGIRRRLHLVAPHFVILLYVMWLIFAFTLGMRYGSPTPSTLRQFAETLLSISLSVILVDLLQDQQALKRLVIAIMLLIGLQALVAVVLYILPDGLAERILIRLGRIGYPRGGVIRYIESNPALGERAIGTWVDPNTLGGVLATGAVMMVPQIFSQKPVLKYRYLTFAVFGITVLALILSSSRSSFVAFSIGALAIAFIRYRHTIPILFMLGLAFALLPQSQNYIDRLRQAIMGEDLATKMRIGEIGDSFELIQRYPLTGIGFTGTPTNDLYTDVANVYLIMSNQIGLPGLFLYCMIMVATFFYGWKAWIKIQEHPDLVAIHLGYHAALFVALINSFGDLYYYRLDFQSSITWFWVIVALALSSSHLIFTESKSTIAQSQAIK